MNEYDLVEIRDIDHDSFKHFVGYEYWMRCGFTDEARIVAEMLSEKYQIPMTMDNGVRIECYIANAYSHYDEECEQWLLFEHTNDHSGRFLTAYNKRLSFDLQVKA